MTETDISMYFSWVTETNLKNISTSQKFSKSMETDSYVAEQKCTQNPQKHLKRGVVGK